MTTATKAKPKTAKAPGEFGEKGEADLFVVHEFAFVPAAEAWLKKRGVRKQEMGIYLGVIDTKDDKSIRLPEWQRRVRTAIRSFTDAGWSEAMTGGYDWLLTKEIDGLSIGISLDDLGVGLHRRWSADARFDERVSETGYRHCSSHGVGMPDPEEVEAMIEKAMREQKKKVEARMKKRKKPATQPTAKNAKRETLLRPISAKQTTALVPAGKQPTATVIVSQAPHLSAAERRQLATLEKTIQKNAAAVFEFGAALKEIRDGRLYRATHTSFEAYCADRWGISKSDGHRQIAAAVTHETVAPIAKRLGIELTSESQMRPLVGVPREDLEPMLKRAKRLAAFAHTRVTAETLARAKREETSSPDDLKREREKAKERKAEKPPALSSQPSTLDNSWPQKAIEGDDAPCLPFTLSDIAGEEEWRFIVGQPPLAGAGLVLDRLIRATNDDVKGAVAFRRGLAMLLDRARKSLAEMRHSAPRSPK